MTQPTGPHSPEASKNGRRNLGTHYQRIVGITPIGSKSLEDRWYEILVTGRDEIGALSKMTAILAQQGVNLAPSGGYYTTVPGTFVWTTFANFNGFRASVDEVTRDLKRLGFVAEVDIVRMEDGASDQFLFPVMISDKSRGIIFSVEPLLRVEQRLIVQLGSAGAALMFDQGRDYAIENFRQLPEALSKSQSTVSMNEAVTWLRTTGWGIFEFDTSQLESAGRVNVRIFEPPNAAVQDSSQSHFANGVAAGVIEAVCGRKAHLASSFYNESEKLLRLTFETF